MGNIKNGRYECKDSQEYEKRYEDCLRSVCDRFLNCEVDDLSKETRNALYHMYKWGEACSGHYYPLGLDNKMN